MKKIFMIAVMFFAVLTFVGCPEDDIPVNRSDVTVHVDDSYSTSTHTPMATPEPTTLLLLGTGLFALGFFARKKK